MTFVTRSCIAKLPSFSHLSTRKAAVSDEAQSNKNGFFFPIVILQNTLQNLFLHINTAGKIRVNYEYIFPK